jgi:hypothetical protein
MRSDKELREIFRHVSAIGLTLDHGHEVLRGCLSEAEYRRLANSPTQRPAALEVAEAASPGWPKELVALLRDIFGNPWRRYAWTDIPDGPPSGHELQLLNRHWLTRNDGRVVKIAQTIYDERRFEDMPKLADALKEAGCTNEEILAHCREEPAVHVRGCWVVDLLLGKK